ncbi:MAG TPA: ADOP family duplicated permease [Thermoanaerobaculia bacterium]|jgi:putative ABC transport system permease protein
MFFRHLRLAARKAVRHPGLTAVAFLTLTLGIAVSATIFTVAWAILLRPFPFHEPDRLIQLWAHDAKGEIAKLELSYEEVEQLQREGRTFEGLSAFCAANFPAVFKRKDEPLHLSVNLIGEPFFRTFGVKPLLGRTFVPAEHAAGAPVTSLLLTYDGWQQRFGGDPAIVGKTLTGELGTSTIVGVLPEHFRIPVDAEVLVPFQPDTDANSRANRILTAVARLKPGRTLDDAAHELRVIASHVVRDHPDGEDDIALLPYSLTDELLGSTRHAVRILFGMGLLVLVIALLNTAAISLAQGMGRHDELGVRSAVGATRAATALQLFAEFFAIALAAAIAALALTGTLLPLLLRLAPSTIPRIAEVRIGVETVVFALAAATLAAVIAAAVQLLSTNEAELLRALRAAAKATSGRRTRRFLELLAAGQVAVAIVTLVVASLLVQSFQRYASIDVGFAREQVITFHLPRGYTLKPELDRNVAFFRDVLQRFRALEGVTAAGAVLMRPLEIEQGWDFAFTLDGQTLEQHSGNPMANLLTATPGYFEAMGIRTLRGRTFNDTDTADSQRVALVSESFARRAWGSVDRAAGKRVKSGKPDVARPWLTVVGVVSDVRYRALTTEKLDIYAPYTQMNWSPNYFALRTTQSPEAVMPAVRAIVAQLAPDIPVASVRTTAQLVDAKLAQPRLSAVIVAIFAATAALLALIGLYGVLAYGVRQRTAEMGVRLAVGATPGNLVALVTRRALAIAFAGAASGIALSFMTSRLWASFVYGVHGVQLSAAALLALAFAAAALVASLVPAVRATRVNPVTALKGD